MTMTMSDSLAHLGRTLEEVERYAGELRSDPDGHVRRSIEELRAAFEGRQAIEPAVARMCQSVDMLRRADHDGRRRECRRRAVSLDHLSSLIQEQLLPELRRLGFEV